MAPPQTALLLLLLAVVVSGQEIFDGPCPHVSVVPNFKLKSYMGPWNEYAKYRVPAKQGFKCSRDVYTEASGGQFRYTKRDIGVAGSWAGRTLKESGQTIPVGTAQPSARFRIEYHGLPTPPANTFNYNIVGTDYTGHSIIWYCENITGPPLRNLQYLYVMTRSASPDQSVTDDLEVKLKTDLKQLNTEKLVKTDQTGCPA